MKKTRTIYVCIYVPRVWYLEVHSNLINQETLLFHSNFTNMSSRLMIKNLPAKLSDAALKKHFSQKGRVTDAKVIKRSDGTSRRFGFAKQTRHTEIVQLLTAAGATE